MQQEMIAKLKDREWRLNNLYWIQDAYGHKVRFKMNKVQWALLKGFWYLNLVLKSRQHGVTTFICILFLDICLFNDDITAGIIAHTREDVEKIFENKIKFAYDNLPEDLKAAIPTDKDTGKILRFANNSSIQVGTSLRGGTNQYLHISEFGKICAKFPEKAREIVTGALNTVHVGQYIVIESTAEGRSGYFYTYCMEALKRLLEKISPSPMEFKIHFFGWYLDPKNRLDVDNLFIPVDLKEYFEELEAKHGIRLDAGQRAWYSAKKNQQGEDMFREYPSTPEEAFLAAIQGAYYQQVMTWLRAQAPSRIGRVPYDPALPVDTGWDLGMDDTTSIVFRQKYGRENRIIDYYENNGEGLQHYAKHLQDKPYVYGKHYLPHDSKVRSLNDKVTREERLYQLGLRNIIVVPRTEDVEMGIEDVRTFLRSCWIDKELCDRLLAALDEYRKEWNEKLGTYRSTPLHNWASNPADAMRTLVCGVTDNEQVSDSTFRDMGLQRSWRVA